MKQSLDLIKPTTIATSADVPEITYFKYVLRKYTPFALDVSELAFEGTVAFDETVFCKLPKNSDLISKLYIKITLPIINSTTYVQTVNANFNSFYMPFINLMVKTTYDLQATINTTLQTLRYSDIINFCKILNTNQAVLNSLISMPQYDKNYDIFYIIYNDIWTLSQYNGTVLSQKILYQLQSYLFGLQLYYKQNYNIPSDLTAILNTRWIKNIGYNIIKQIKLSIGSNDLVLFDPDLLFIYRQLMRYTIDDVYDELIDATYVKKESNVFSLYIPLEFWFTKIYQISFQNIALILEEIILSVSFNSAAMCIIGNIQQPQFSANIIAETVYLSEFERKIVVKDPIFQFIEQFQLTETKFDIANITNKLTIPLDFINPIKMFVFVLYCPELQQIFDKKNNYSANQYYKINSINQIGNYIVFNLQNIHNITVADNIDLCIGNNIIKLNIEFITDHAIYTSLNPEIANYLTSNIVDYGVITKYGDSVVTDTTMSIGNYIRFKNYGNTIIQNYQYNLSSVDNGIHQLNFGLKPYDINIAGQLNFTVIDKSFLELTLDSDYITYLKNNMTDGTLLCKIYAISYNLIKIAKGVSELIFAD